MSKKAIITELFEAEITQGGAAIPGPSPLKFGDFSVKEKSTKASVNGNAVMMGTMTCPSAIECKNPTEGETLIGKVVSLGFTFTGSDKVMSVEGKTIHCLDDEVTCTCSGFESTGGDSSKQKPFTGSCTIKLAKTGQGTDKVLVKN